jgi:hypothetical protein
MGTITRADHRLAKVLHHHSICDGFLAECGSQIIVDDPGRPAIPVEREDN